MTVALCLLGLASVACVTAIDGVTAAESAVPADEQFTSQHSRASPAIWRASSNVVHVYVDEDATPPQFSAPPLPPNLLMPAAFRDTVESMLRLSPTFRRQCARLMNARQLTVIADSAVLMGGSRATTSISVTTEGSIVARVLIGPFGDREELLAHEFEHIIEQLDGVDLTAMARRATTGVRVTEDAGRFETERAVAVGRRVVEEIRTARRRGD